MIEKAFVSFTTNDKYVRLSEIMIKSINHYSKYPLILYCVNFDAPDFKGNYKNVIYKRINFDPSKQVIYYLKPEIILDSIDSFNVQNGVYIESDDIATQNIDKLFDECDQTIEYPLSPIHPHDPNNQSEVMKYLGVNTKTIPYIHAHLVYSSRHREFISDWYQACVTLNFKVKANWDETVLNVMYWKYNATKYIDYFYDPYYSQFLTNTDIPPHVYMLHGCKSYDIARKIYKKMIHNK